MRSLIDKLEIAEKVMIENVFGGTQLAYIETISIILAR